MKYLLQGKQNYSHGKKEEILAFKLEKKGTKNLHFLTKYITEFGRFITWRLQRKFFRPLYFSEVLNIVTLYLCAMGEALSQLSCIISCVDNESQRTVAFTHQLKMLF